MLPVVKNEKNGWGTDKGEKLRNYSQQINYYGKPPLYRDLKHLEEEPTINRSCCVCTFCPPSCCKGMVTAMALNKAGHLEKNPAKELHELNEMKVIALSSLYFCLFSANFLG